MVCCSFITIGQLYERVVGPPGTCLKVSGVLAGLYVCASISEAFSDTYNYPGDPDMELDTAAMVLPAGRMHARNSL